MTSRPTARASRPAPLRALALAACAAAGAAAGAAACNDKQSTDPADQATITLTPVSTTAPADGATLVQLTARVPAATRSDKRQVVFSTSAGTLTEGSGKDATIVVDGTGAAIATLRAPTDPVTAQVRATAGGAVALATVTFAPAPPERVDVEPERLAVHGTGADEIKVTAFLRRSLGRASAGTAVTFSATDSTGTPIGLINPTTSSDANGTAVSRFNPGATNYRGRVTLRATVAGVAAQAGAGTTTVVVIP